MNKAGMIWLFNLGTDFVSKTACYRTKLIHNTLLLPYLQKSNGAAKAPYGSHRLRLAALAASALPNHS